MAFNAKQHLIRVSGNREHLPVAARLLWFRQEHPDWGILTRHITIDTERMYAIFCCTILDDRDTVVATATSIESFRGFPDYVEKAETSSIGRALGMCGYGTQFGPEFGLEERVARPYWAKA